MMILFRVKILIQEFRYIVRKVEKKQIFLMGDIEKWESLIKLLECRKLIYILILIFEIYNVGLGGNLYWFEFCFKLLDIFDQFLRRNLLSLRLNLYVEQLS